MFAHHLLPLERRQANPCRRLAFKGRWRPWPVLPFVLSSSAPGAASGPDSDRAGVFMAKSTAGIGPKGQAKIATVMHEWGKGQLHSGSKRGPVVKNQRQAVAIALNQGRQASHAGRGGLLGSAAGKK